MVKKELDCLVEERTTDREGTGQTWLVGSQGCSGCLLSHLNPPLF